MVSPGPRQSLRLQVVDQSKRVDGNSGRQVNRLILRYGIAAEVR